ncbi:MAG: GGDEF domain-containing protein [Desulfovibrionales bacterium]
MKNDRHTEFKLDLIVQREIEELCKVLEAVEPGDSEQSNLAVFRLFKGVPVEEWEHLAKKFGLSNWLAVPFESGEFQGLDALQARIDQLIHQSTHDPLTGIANRRAFREALSLEIERSHRLKTPMSLAILDIDDFKDFNDRYGHLCGDAVLVEMSATIRNQIRKLDFAARLGGEEFGIILTGSGIVDAHKVLERIKGTINALQIPCDGGTIVSPSCSIGVACYKGSVPINPKDIISEADKALYRAKEQGKNRIVSAVLMGYSISDSTLVKQEEKRFLLSEE